MHRALIASADVRPTRSLWLLVVAHAFNHAQVAVLPLIYLAIIDEWGVSVTTIAFLTAASSLASGAAPILRIDTPAGRFSVRTLTPAVVAIFAWLEYVFPLLLAWSLSEMTRFAKGPRTGIHFSRK